MRAWLLRGVVLLLADDGAVVEPSDGLVAPAARPVGLAAEEDLVPREGHRELGVLHEPQPQLLGAPAVDTAITTTGSILELDRGARP